MIRLKWFLVVILTLAGKDGVFSCSLPSHKLGSSLISDSTSISHHTAIVKPQASHCDSSSDSSSGLSSNLSSPLNHSTTSTILTLPSGTPSSTPTPVLSSTPISSYNNNSAVLDLIIKLLSSSSLNKTSSISQIPFSFPSLIPPLTTLNLKPHATSSLCTSKPSLGSSKLPCDSAVPSTINLISSLKSSFPTPSLNTNSVPNVVGNSNLMDLLLKHLSFTPEFTTIPSNKLSQFSPLKPLFTSNLHKSTILDSKSKPPAISYPCTPSTGSSSTSSNILPNLSCGSLSPPKVKIPEILLVPIKTPDSEIFELLPSNVTQELPLEKFPAQTTSLASKPVTNPVAVPEEFPKTVSKPISTSTLVPVTKSTPITQTSTNHSHAVINLLLKSLYTQKPNELSTSTTPTLPIRCSPFKSFLNTTPMFPLIPKLHHNPCVTSSGFNSCVSNVKPDLLNCTILPPTPTTNIITPPPIKIPKLTSNIPLGYNPSFIKFLMKLMFTNKTSLPVPLFPTFSQPQQILNNTLLSSSISSPSLPLTSTEPLLIIKPNTVLKKNVPPPTIIQPNSSYDQKLNVTNHLLLNLLTSLNASNTPHISPSTVSNPQFVPILNINPVLTHQNSTSSPVYCISPLNQFFSILCKLSGITSDLPFSDKPQVSMLQLPTIKPLSEPSLSTIPEIPPPVLCPQPPTAVNKCRLKSLELPKLTSSSSDVNPCHKKFAHKHVSHLSSPCSHL